MKLLKNLPTKIGKTGRLESWATFWCDECKQEVERRLSDGKIDKSCGCDKIKHGESNTRLYRTWKSMKSRILNLNNEFYKDYGGRGITICNEWLEFIPFRDWSLTHGYKENLQIDRKENEGNYEPTNCRWATAKENANNRRGKKLTQQKVNEIKFKYNSGYTQAQLAKEYNVSRVTIFCIVNNKLWRN